MKVSELIKGLLEKAGLDLKDAAFADVLSLQTELADDKAKAVQDYLGGLLTKDAAKNNQELFDHFKVKSLLPLDTEIAKLIDHYKIPDELKTELAKEQSSYKKTTKLIEVLRELARKEEAAKYSDINRTTETLDTEIKRLNKLIADNKDSHVNDLKTAQEKAEEQILEFALLSELRGFNYSKSMFEKVPESVKLSVAQNLVKEHFAKEGVKLIRKDNELIPMQTNNPDLRYMKDNKDVATRDIITKLFADNGLLEVSGQGAGSAGATNTPPTIDTTKLPIGNQKAMQELQAMITKQ